MEMLVISGQQDRNQYYSRNHSKFSNGFHISPSRGLKGFNCRSFESNHGIIPYPPSKPHSFTIFQEPTSPFSHSEPPKHRKRSSPILIKSKKSPADANFSDDFSHSELWAGPAYSNSPPPSSLPIPKFSLRQKRSISLELPIAAAGITPHLQSKSAPTSPTRESLFHATDFFHDTASATENLRRILHLDIADN